MRGSVFEHVGNEKQQQPIGGGAPAHHFQSIALPVSAPSILPDTSYLRGGSSSPAADGGGILVVRGDEDVVADAAVVEGGGGGGGSLLTLRASNQNNKASTHNWSKGDHLCQTIESPVIVVGNPTDATILVSEFWVEVLRGGDQWVKVESRVGRSCTGHYGREVDFSNSMFSFSVKEHSAVELVWEGTFTIPLGRNQPYPNPYHRRIHGEIKSLCSDPLKARLNLKDDSGKVKVLSYEVTNDPLTDLWSTYEEAVASTTESVYEFGQDFNCDMWLCVENPLTLCKSILCISSAKKNPNHWAVRMSSDRRNIGGNYRCFCKSDLERHAFQATRAGAVVDLDGRRANGKLLEIDLDLLSEKYCKLTGLVDCETCQVYALHGEIHIQTEAGETIAWAEAYMRLDYEVVVEE